MNQTLSLDNTTIKQIIRKLQKLEELKFSLLSSIPEKAFKSGSTLWWDKVEQMAENDIKNGNLKQYKNMKDLIKDLHS